jgi:hypothetical protein
VIARLAAAITTGIALAVFVAVACAPYWLGYAHLPERAAMTRDAVHSALTGTRNGLPGPKPYVYGGDERDAEVAAKIADARATLAAGRRDEAADVYDPDLPPYEWYREMADTPPDPAPAEVSRCDTCGYLVTAVGHQIACGDTP